MSEKSFTNMRSLLGALADAMNLINPDVENHHQQAAYLSYMTAKAAGFADENVELAIYAALLHDLGSVMTEYSESVSEIEKNAVYVAHASAKMLSGIPGLDNTAAVVALCQYSWETLMNIAAAEGASDTHIYRTASIVHLADVVSVLIQPGTPLLVQAGNIRSIISGLKDTEFSAEAVDAFMRVSELEFVWFDAVLHPSFLYHDTFAGDIHYISLERTAELTLVMSRLIDFRSSFTAMHSAGVSASAEKIARLCGMSEDDCVMMRIAGYLHDVGKIKIPKSILEKPGRLTKDEFSVIKEHPYYTRLILMNVDGFEKIADWAGFHHEKLNGSGYPFHSDRTRLDEGSRILAAADIFSALTEIRPYRDGMPKDAVLKILREGEEKDELCPHITALIADNYEEIDHIRDTVSKEAGKRYFDSLEKKQ